MFNQYQPPYQTYQPYQPPLPRGLSGRVVSSVSEVSVGEVPNDGTAGYFPARDGSCVWVKQWMGDGSIATVRYVPEAPVEPPETRDRMDEVLARLDSIEAALKPKKKKVADDE